MAYSQYIAWHGCDHDLEECRSEAKELRALRHENGDKVFKSVRVSNEGRHWDMPSGYAGRIMVDYESWTGEYCYQELLTEYRYQQLLPKATR